MHIYIFILFCDVKVAIKCIVQTRHRLKYGAVISVADVAICHHWSLDVLYI